MQSRNPFIKPSKPGLILLRPKSAHPVSGWARRLLTRYFGLAALGSGHLPHTIQTWLRSHRRSSSKKNVLTYPRRPLTVERGGSRLVIKPLFERGLKVLVLEEQILSPKSAFVEFLGLTPREADVLLWVARGKTNADIGKILSRSPRTIGKHLERIYEKLSVETRTAAAAIALTLNTKP
ncbi:MAG: hypothetical protein HYY46_24270 [Deltaproteobacteria bacterium]|nr:hypothetical protein [Deltaproteobacteria bacterium]